MFQLDEAACKPAHSPPFNLLVPGDAQPDQLAQPRDRGCSGISHRVLRDAEMAELSEVFCY